MNKPVVGQKMFKLNIGNNVRRVPQCLTEVIVSKVGRKYFSVIEDGRPFTEIQFSIEDRIEKTEYSAGWCIYESAKEYEDEKESSSICREIKESFEYGNNRKKLSLHALRKIKEILDGCMK
jgi:hypothetical protein